jgi:DNA replication protein DnaC
MQLVEILTFLDRFSLEQRGRRMEQLERDILEIVWENKTYQDIGSYHEQTVKNKALLLWKYLSQLLNTKVDKRNVRKVLEQRNFEGIFSTTLNSANTGDLLFCGRSKELLQLQQWIEVDRCKSIFIYGMKGIGKSYIAQKIANMLAANLDYLVWIPLERPIPLIDILSTIVRQIGAGRSAKLSNDLSTAIDKTISYLQKNRCLLILDNADVVLGNKRQPTNEIDGLIEEYRIFFDRLNSAEHDSHCLTILAEKNLRLGTNDRQLEIQGLNWQSCQTILTKDELTGKSSEWEILVEKYHGNLQYLKSIAPIIKNVFGGSIRQFLDADILVYNRIEESISDLMANLSEQEISIIICLANHSQGIALERINDIFHEEIEYRELIEILDKLISRHLVKLHGDRFVLSDLVAEYTTDRYLDSGIDRGDDAYVRFEMQQHLY